MDELFDKDKETLGLDEPAPNPTVKLHEDPKNALELAQKLLISIATARIGFIVFSHYAARFQLKDRYRFIFRIFLILAYILDFTLGICVVVIVLWLLIGIVYATLRGLDVVNQANHIVVLIVGGLKKII